MVQACCAIIKGKRLAWIRSRARSRQGQRHFSGTSFRVNRCRSSRQSLVPPLSALRALNPLRALKIPRPYLLLAERSSRFVVQKLLDIEKQQQRDKNEKDVVLAELYGCD